jgi:uncharacterized protein with ParB-like and HNH nuclease domain
MSAEKSVTRSIDGKGRTVRELLSAKRYSIDYYQREYKWETKQITELIIDLQRPRDEIPFALATIPSSGSVIDHR